MTPALRQGAAVVVVWILAIAMATSRASAQVPTALPPAEEDELILQVEFDQQVIAEGLIGYRRDGHILLPLGELAQLLTIAIRTDPAHGTASGFVLTEDRDFFLDATRATVIRSSQKSQLDPALLRVTSEDIYVAAPLLEEWLPVFLRADISALTLLVEAREPLPLQQRLERKRLATRLSVLRQPLAAGFMRRDSPYRWLEIPQVDVSLEGLHQRSDGARRSDGRYALFATGDLLRMEGSLYASGGTSAYGQEVRATLARTDPAGGLLGPLNARQIALGSVAVPGLPNISRTSASGYGLWLTNRALTRSNAFGQHSLQGALPPGWDVELYFNDVLVGLQQSSASGLYNFNDLSLVAGASELRLVFHGPQGQQRVERQTLYLEESIAAAGRLEYSLAAHRVEGGQVRAAGQFDYGLGGHVSANAGFAALSLADENRRYVFGGVRGLLGPTLLNADYILDQDGGSLVEAGFRTRYRRWTLAASQDWLRGFESESFPLGPDRAVTRQTIRSDGFFSLFGAARMGLGLQFRRDRLASGQHQVEVAARLGAYYRGTALTNEVHRVDAFGSIFTDGTFQWSRRIARMGLRGQIDYQLQPKRRLSAVTVSGDRLFRDGYAAGLSLTHSLLPRETTYSAAVNKTLGSFALGVRASYSSLDRFAIGFNLLFSLSPDPARRRVRFDALPRADSGTVLARVFVDQNDNGMADVGEELVENAELLVNGGRRPLKTNADGLVLLDQLTPREFADIGIDPASLEDPQWNPDPRGIRTVPRAGHLSRLDFPVVQTAEIEGTVSRRVGEAWRGVGGVAIELRDYDGNVVQQTETAPDGFYILESVPPGDYQIVLPEHLQDTDGTVALRPVSIFPNAPSVPAVDFRIGPAATH